MRLLEAVAGESRFQRTISQLSDLSEVLSFLAKEALMGFRIEYYRKVKEELQIQYVVNSS